MRRLTVLGSLLSSRPQSICLRRSSVGARRRWRRKWRALDEEEKEADEIGMKMAKAVSWREQWLGVSCWRLVAMLEQTAFRRR